MLRGYIDDTPPGVAHDSAARAGHLPRAIA
jgi:hypothetical protein